MKNVILGTAFLCGAFSAAAADVPADSGPSTAARVLPVPMTLEWVKGKVLKNNPEILAAEAGAEAEGLKVYAEAEMLGLEIGTTFSGMPWGSGFSSPSSRSLDLGIRIPFIGKSFSGLSAGYRAALKGIEETHQVKLQKLFEAEQAYLDLVAAGKKSRAVEKAVKALEKLAALSGKRNRLGQASRMEQLMDPMTRAELASVKSRALDIEKEQQRAFLSLIIMMQLDDWPDGPLPETVEPVEEDVSMFDGDKGLSKAATGSPELFVAREDIMLKENLRKTARGGLFPDLMAQVSDITMEDGAMESMFMLKMDLPFISLARWDRYHAAGAEEKEAQTRYVQAVAVLAEKFFLTRWGHKTAGKQAVLYEEEILPQSEKALDLAVTGYQSGSVGPSDALAAVRMYVDAQMEYADVKAKRAKYAAEINRLAGN